MCSSYIGSLTLKWCSNCNPILHIFLKNLQNKVHKIGRVYLAAKLKQPAKKEITKTWKRKIEIGWKGRKENKNNSRKGM